MYCNFTHANTNDKLFTKRSFMMGKNVLIVDGYSSGKFYADILKKKGYNPYHLITGLEKNPDYAEIYHTDLFNADKYIKNFTALENLEKTKEMLESYNFVAVIPGSEGSVLYANRLANLMDLPHNRGAVSGVLTNKYKMQQALAKANISHIRSILTAQVDEAIRWKKDNGFDKVVVKPTSDATTRGVYICSTEQSVRNAFSKVLNTLDSCSNINDKLIVQEFIDGDEYIVNHVSQNNVRYLTDIYHYRKIQSPDGNPLYDAIETTSLNNNRLQEMVSYVENVLDALQLDVGASHAEVKMSSHGPVLIEVGARLMGSIPEELFAIFEPSISAAIDSYIDEPEQFKNKKDFPINMPPLFALIKLLISYKKKKLISIPAIDLLSHLPTFKWMDCEEALKKMEIPKTENLTTNVAKVLLASPNEEDVLKDYAVIRFLEEEKPYILFRAKDDPDLSDEDNEITKQIKAGTFSVDESRYIS